MAEPISGSMMALAALSALSAGAQGVAGYMSEKKKAKNEKKKIREVKRKTFADLLNEALNRSHDTAKDTRRSQADLSGARAKALQEAAAGIRQSLAK